MFKKSAYWRKLLRLLKRVSTLTERDVGFFNKIAAESESDHLSKRRFQREYATPKKQRIEWKIPFSLESACAMCGGVRVFLVSLTIP